MRENRRVASGSVNFVGDSFRESRPVLKYSSSADLLAMRAYTTGIRASLWPRVAAAKRLGLS